MNVWNWIKKHYLLLTSLAVAGFLLWLWFPTIWTNDTTLAAQLTGQKFYRTIYSAGVLLAVLQFFLATWIKARVEQSVKHEYDRHLEEYRYSMRVREQAAKVAELLALAKWKEGTQGRDFDEMAYTLSLWLPPDILREMKVCCLGGVTEEKNKEVLLRVRQHLLKENPVAIGPNDILYFTKND